MSRFEEQTINSDCKYCKCKYSQTGKDCCFASCTNHCLLYITDFDSVDNKNNDFCSTCLCTLLCIGPKFAVTLPMWPFTCYNFLRNKCKDTKNVNYIC